MSELDGRVPLRAAGTLSTDMSSSQSVTSPPSFPVRHIRIVVTHYDGPDALQVVDDYGREPTNGDVRPRVLAAGVSLPDLLAREGVHPRPRTPFTPGWDLVGVVDRLGAGVSGIKPGQIVAAMPISGAYAEFGCLPQRELIQCRPDWMLPKLSSWC